MSAFTVPDRELSGAELARRTSLPRSTVHRLAAELTEHGLLEHTPSGRFRLGMRLFELGHLALYQRGLRESASAYLADLSNATRETVHLAVLDDQEVVYLDIIRPSGAPNLRSRLGGRLPPTATAVGKAILAFSPSSVIESVIAAGLPRLTPYSITDTTKLIAELNNIRHAGIAFDHQEQALGTLCCAAPVFGIGNKVVAAVSVSGRLGVMRTDRVKMAVRSTAAGISRLQGAA
jgi:DNA-binding IclR family transcriptional regulator